MEELSGDKAWGDGTAQDKQFTLVSLFFSMFPLSLEVLGYLRTRNELDLVFWKDSNLALVPYRMCLCVGYAQQHRVLSMKQENPTTAEKVWKWSCLFNNLLYFPYLVTYIQLLESIWETKP